MIHRRTTARRLSTALLLLMTVGFLGGAPTAPDFGDPLAGLTTDETLRFQAGVTEFTSVQAISDGLGPVFNDVSCAACHTDPATGGGSSTRFVTRFGRSSNDMFDPLTELGGSLIQSQGIGRVGRANFVGEVVPRHANVVARRRTTPLFGLGLVEAIPDDLLLSIAAEQQFRFPQVAGRASLVIDPSSTDMRVGRFGWKAQHASLFTFGGDAYLNEVGITTPLFPTENCPQGNCEALAWNPVPAINDSLSALQALSDFISFLAPPSLQPISRAGRGGDRIFASIGCAVCHVPTLQSGPSPVAALNHVTFHPYSDFLLHDMGPLGDGIVQEDTGAREMRTAPLWGLRNVSAYLHDGRASTLGDAILAHDGQAQQARNSFSQLSSGDKSRLIAFLNSL